MKIIVVGGTGTIGSAVVSELSKNHEVITVSNKNSDVCVDITNMQSIQHMYKTIGRIDGVVSTTGQVHFGALADFNTDLYQVGLHSKLLGQVNLVLAGLHYINDNGSFTLTSGILNHDPIVLGSGASMVNGALDGFVTGAAIEMPRNIRINVVSPTVVQESMDKYADFFRGFEPAAKSRVALAYSKSVNGAQTGQIYKVW